jgi:hypothetical protein
MGQQNVGLDDLRSALKDADVRALDVSQWTVGMHVHHCCLGMIGVCKALIASSPPAPPARFSMAASYVFLTGRIPRGRGKAAEAVTPRPGTPPEEIMPLLDESERLLARARELDRGAWFKHFAFGVLERDRALRFTTIHNRHHLRIVADILKR